MNLLSHIIGHVILRWDHISHSNPLNTTNPTLSCSYIHPTSNPKTQEEEEEELQPWTRTITTKSTPTLQLDQKMTPLISWSPPPSILLSLNLSNLIPSLPPLLYPLISLTPLWGIPSVLKTFRYLHTYIYINLSVCLSICLINIYICINFSN